MDEDIAFKIIVIGSMSVGKSSVTTRFCDDAFFADHIPTLGMDFKYTRCATLGPSPRNVRLQIWDTSGQDTFATLTTAFYRNCQGAVLCFDLTSRQSFDDLDNWFDLIKRHTTSLPPLLLVGCKLDLVTRQETGADQERDDGILLGNRRQVQESEADAWAREHGCLCYLETSAKSNQNVSEAFQQLATHVAAVSGKVPAGRGKQSQFSGADLKDDGRKATERRRCC